MNILQDFHHLYVFLIPNFQFEQITFVSLFLGVVESAVVFLYRFIIAELLL